MTRAWMSVYQRIYVFFFFNDTATTEIYTLSLHDALPIYRRTGRLIGEHDVEGGADVLTAHVLQVDGDGVRAALCHRRRRVDRKSTRLNSSHDQISYAVFCLKQKKRIDLPLCSIPPPRQPV